MSHDALLDRPGWIRLAAIAAALGAVSLIPLSQVTGPDPNAWLAWAYQLLHGNGVDFGNGPAWKPLPVIMMTPASLLGTDVTAAGWLFTVRFAAVWCSAMLFVLVRGDGGLAGGLIAALLPLTIVPWVNTVVVGESEPVALALVLSAAVMFVERRPRATTVLLVLAGLLRPEVWPLLALQLLHRRRNGDGPVLLDSLLAAGVLIGCWLAGPALVTAGGTVTSMQGGVTMKDATIADVGSNILGVLPPKAWVLIPIGVVQAVLLRRTTTLLLAAGAGLLTLEIVVLWALHPPISDAGYTPVLRYFAVAGVMLCGVAGSGAGWLTDLARRPAAKAAVTAALVLLVGWSALSAVDGTRQAVDRSIASGRDAQQAVGAILKAGGMERLAPCRPLTITEWSAIGWSISRRLEIPLAWIGTRRHLPSAALDFTRGGWVLQAIPPEGTREIRVLSNDGNWRVVEYRGASSWCAR